MLTSDFDYNLPANLIAQTPLPRRDQSRMMVLHRKSGEIIHSNFKNFPEYINKGEVLVLNQTKVIPSKVWGRKENDDIDFLFLKEREIRVWEVLCRPSKKVNIHDKIRFTPFLTGKVTGIEPEGKRIIRLSIPNVISELKKFGYAPLPPYIKRKKKHEKLKFMDLDRYQTIFAQKEGAIAAPTAGLHFTNNILEKINKKDVHVIKIVLDVGQATFKPIRVERVENHKMLEENYSISPTASLSIEEAKKESKSIVAVGTTVVRALESAFKDGKISTGKNTTDLFIYPGYKFNVVDRLLTNFHLPKSTLLMMVSAFSSLELIKIAYKEAVKKKYRFYSYGDCMLIL